MMHLSHIRRPSKKPLLILAGIVLAVIILCGGGWWYNASQATTKYSGQKGEYIAQSTKELKAINDEFKALAQQSDTKRSLEALAKLQATLDSQINSVPALPQLFGVTLTPVEVSQKRGIYIERLTQLKKTVTAARDFMVYQQVAAAILQEVTTKTGPNAEQQKAMADAWAAMAAKLKALPVPGEAVSAHQQIVSVVEATHASLATLPDLFNKKDISGFEAKQKEAEAHVASLRGIGDAVRIVAVRHDKNIARDYAALQEVMK